ncbi:metal-dependent hydrolase [Paenibacillus sp. TRM 82003]|nr:metal-dependent hydrolase [Paenibacillus sp. TRM 82003]
MDTGSHLLFGATLTGLAMADPVIAAHPERLAVTAAALMLSSHAPDFDTIVRFWGRGAYLRWHRGISHSLPALPLWPLLVMIPYAAVFGFSDPAVWHVYLWSFAAVVFHVLLDALNGYGVQCLRPFTKRWVHLDVLTICDPYLFGAHALALGVWLGGLVEPAMLFPPLYAATFGYIAWRAWRHRRWVRKLRRQLQATGVCYVTPCLHWWKWSFVAEREERFVSGFIHRGVLTDVVEVGKGEPTEGHPVIEASKATDGVRAFLSFAQRVHVAMTESEDGYTVRWSEMRFVFGEKLPFGVDIQMDRNYGVVSERIGWQKKAWEGPYV